MSIITVTCGLYGHILLPLNNLTSSNIKFRWTGVEQKLSDKMKHIVVHDTLLSYPEFFLININIDASDLQLGSVTSQ